nr:VWA domain-containing protein [Deltaproteobacteria bacterium]
MATPFGLVAACEYKSAEPAVSRLWASIRVDPQGKALEAERAPLAVVLVIDTSGSMQGDPLHHVLSSCALLGELLDARDQLAIVTFADHAGIRCGLTTVDPGGRAAIKAALAGVTANGSTNMHGGIEVAAGVLVTAPAGLRRVMVVMSDGQPNIGIATADGLASYVRSLKLAVSTLGFGLHHDENVLDAIATAGSGRYAYIPDPMIARVDLARAALAHGGVVADHLELRIKLEDGVELLQILPATPLRHGGHGVVTALGDVFIDEGRLVAIELQLDLSRHPAAQRGRLAELVVEGR